MFPAALPSQPELLGGGGHTTPRAATGVSAPKSQYRKLEAAKVQVTTPNIFIKAGETKGNSVNSVLLLCPRFEILRSNHYCSSLWLLEGGPYFSTIYVNKDQGIFNI